MELYQELEIPSVVNPRILLPKNPIWVVKEQIKSFENQEKNPKYKVPPVSKCGLGKTQGTKGLFRGMALDSYWEAAFYIWMVDIKGCSCHRNLTESFDYVNSEGKDAKFYPDFKTMEFGFAEVKGRWREDDLLKREATAGVVTFFGGEEMKPILKEVYNFNPKWKDEYNEVTRPVKYGKKN